MHKLLEQDKTNITSVLSEIHRMAENYFKQQNDLAPGKYVENIKLMDMPEKGIGAISTLSLFEREFAPLISNTAGPRYFGFVTGGSTPAAVAGDWLVSTYDQNAFGSNDSIAPQLERQTIHFFKQLFGLEEAYFGSFVTGATVSNMVGLSLGRQWVGEQLGKDFSNDGLYGSDRIAVFSATPHSSAIKSLSILGMGRNSLQKIKTLAGREAIDVQELEKALQQFNGPAIVIANAGTVNTVDFDDLEAIGKLKSKYRLWLHVDMAFGGFAGLSKKYKHLVNGTNHADSITIDAHKWLNVPYDAAMLFTKHKNLQLKVFQNSAAYLGDPNQSPDFFHYTPENSRRWRALPSWFTLMAYGKEGHTEIVERNCAMAEKLGNWISSSSKFRLLAPVNMNVVCFTLNKEQPATEEIKDLLVRVRDDGRTFFTPTVYNNIPAIRAAISNWLTTENDINITIEALKSI
jgi:glutamate/tyrosine decarboxylase-like PLP-dependent enzyme